MISRNNFGTTSGVQKHVLAPALAAATIVVPAIAPVVVAHLINYLGRLEQTILDAPFQIYH